MTTTTRARPHLLVISALALVRCAPAEIGGGDADADTDADADATACEVTVDPQVGPLEATFTTAMTSNGSGCTWSFDGTPQGETECTTGEVPILGSDVGPGAHTLTLHVGAGPRGAAECSTGFRVLGPEEDGETTCTFTVEPSVGGPETTFTATTTSNGSGCAWSFDGTLQGETECTTGEVPFLGADAGPGAHTLTLHVGDGPGGAAECDAGFTVTEESEPASCVRSSLADAAAIEEAGFALRGGTFRDGGWAVDATCDRIEQTLPGDWSRGSVAIEARDLLRVIPFDEGTHGCERFILNVNQDGGDTPERTRVAFANMAGDCGAERGNLRAIVFGGPCCVDTGRLPDESDGLWHAVRLEWDGSIVRIVVDGEEWASAGYEGVDIGSDVDLQIGSECAEGDETRAVFRNLEVCPL